MPLPPTKEIVAEAEAGARGLLSLALRLMRLVESTDKHAKLIEAQAAGSRRYTSAANGVSPRGNATRVNFWQSVTHLADQPDFTDAELTALAEFHQVFEAGSNDLATGWPDWSKDPG